MDQKTISAFGIEALNTIADTKRIFRKSTSGVYADIAAGKLVAVKIGGSTLITGESIIAAIESAPKAVITTGLRGRDDLTEEQRARLVAPSPKGVDMHARRWGRPIGSKSRTWAEVQHEIGDRPAI
jgi:hypothetical protein